jgi:hypothetical protein
MHPHYLRHARSVPVSKRDQAPATAAGDDAATSNERARSEGGSPMHPQLHIALAADRQRQLLADAASLPGEQRVERRFDSAPLSRRSPAEPGFARREPRHA